MGGDSVNGSRGENPPNLAAECERVSPDTCSGLKVLASPTTAARFFEVSNQTQQSFEIERFLKKYS